MLRRRIRATTLVLLFAVRIALGQSGTADLTGIVSDSAGAGCSVRMLSLRPICPQIREAQRNGSTQQLSRLAAQFTLGNASRNPVRGPNYRDADIAFIKHTQVAERVDLEFRAEIFNLANTLAFGQPNGSWVAARSAPSRPLQRIRA